MLLALGPNVGILARPSEPCGGFSLIQRSNMCWVIWLTRILERRRDMILDLVPVIVFNGRNTEGRNVSARKRFPGVDARHDTPIWRKAGFFRLVFQRSRYLRSIPLRVLAGNPNWAWKIPYRSPRSFDFRVCAVSTASASWLSRQSLRQGLRAARRQENYKRVQLASDAPSVYRLLCGTLSQS